MKIRLNQIFYTSFASICFFVIFWFILYTVSQNEFWDFNVFYSSAQTALRGENIYRTYGQNDFPYWYFPWVSWLFIPLVIFPFQTAKIVHIFITLVSVFFVVHSLGRYFNAQLSFAKETFIMAMSLLMCWLLFRVGQVDFILIAIITAAIFLIDKKKNVQAGFLFPIFLFKPHLVVLFLPFVFLKGGKKFFFSATISVLFLSLAAFVFMPNWPSDMLSMLAHNGQRVDNSKWDFTTFAEFIGRAENWSGTANIPITIILILLSFIVLWKSRHLPTVSFLAFTLLASVLCAPRAYSYNFPFLLPALLWLSVEKTNQTILFWAGIGVLSVLTGFSTGAYLIVVLTFLLAIWKSHKVFTAKIRTTE